MPTHRVTIVSTLVLLIATSALRVSATGIACGVSPPSDEAVLPWTLVFDLAEGQGKIYSFQDEVLRAQLNHNLGKIASCEDPNVQTCLDDLDKALRARETLLKEIREGGTVQKRVISHADDKLAIYVFYRPIDGRPEIRKPTEEARASRLQTDLQTLVQIGIALATRSEPAAIAKIDRFPVERGLDLCVATYTLQKKRAEVTLKARLLQTSDHSLQALKTAITIKEQILDQAASATIEVEKLRLEIAADRIEREIAENARKRREATERLRETHRQLAATIGHMNDLGQLEKGPVLLELEIEIKRRESELADLENDLKNATDDALERLQADKEELEARIAELEEQKERLIAELPHIGDQISKLDKEIDLLQQPAAAEDASETLRAGLIERLVELHEGNGDLDDPDFRREVLELFELSENLDSRNGESTVGARGAASEEAEFVEGVLRTGPTERLHLSTDIPVNEVEQLQIDDENQQLVLRDEPSRFYLGLNYQFGDAEIQHRGKRFWKNFYLKGMIEASSEPLDSWGVGVGLNGIPFAKSFLDLSTLAPFIGYTFTKEADSETDGTLAPKAGRNAELRFGMSLNLTKALAWIQGAGN